MEELEKVNYKYIFSDDYNPKYVNGAYGGVSPNGDIIAHFYMERPALPIKMVHKIEGGALGDEIPEDREPKDQKHSFVRFIQGGVVMDYATAKVFQNWLEDKIAEIEKRIGINQTDQKDV